MQPYFVPYIGYFQLIQAADKFVVYDNIQFTKKGWINRNRILVNGKDEYISIPLKKDSDYLNIDQRVVSELFVSEGAKTLRKIKELYRKAPYFENTFPVIEKIFAYPETNLFGYIYYSLRQLCDHLNMDTEFVISSSLDIDHSLKSEEKVIALCEALKADTYINPIGGVELYSKQHFKEKAIELCFSKSNPIIYKQFDHEFVPWLSIIDVMMFNSKEQISEMLNAYTFQ